MFEKQKAKKRLKKVGIDMNKKVIRINENLDLVEAYSILKDAWELIDDHHMHKRPFDLIPTVDGGFLELGGQWSFHKKTVSMYNNKVNHRYKKINSANERKINSKFKRL